MKVWRYSSYIFLILFLVLFSVKGDVMASEEAKYTVIMKDGEFELRQYEPEIIAETIVEGDFAEVGNEGFRRLFKYISGNNSKKQSISMTAPVSQAKSSEKIEMTAPVNLEEVGDKWRITFFMPSKYTMETLPEPLDSRVELKKNSARLVAAIKYSGTWSRSRYEEKKAQLYEMIKKRDLKPTEGAIFARYDSPFTLWFLRRNEVLIPVGEVHK
jgi:SOUL heme-binding protein